MMKIFINEIKLGENIKLKTPIHDNARNRIMPLFP
jgi:hypothetical protein